MGNERELVAIKVRIGLKPNGHAEYPNFNELGSVRKENMDWAIYVDQFGIGWQYDKTSGHKEHSEDSPAGMQWGMLLVPTDFAREAVEMFPDKVQITGEVEFEDFYDNKAHGHEPDEIVDERVLEGIRAKKEVGIGLSPMQVRALDVEDDEVAGIKRNRTKKWGEAKGRFGVKVVDGGGGGGRGRDRGEGRGAVQMG